MSIPVRRSLTGLALAVAAVTAISGTAFAHPEPVSDGAYPVSDEHRDTHQHGETTGHLPPSNSGNIDVVSRLKLKNVVPEKIADVGVLGNYAYLAAWGQTTCRYNGVHVVNIADVNNPREVAFIASKEGSYPGEGVQALHVDTPYFNGDLLVTNNEQCINKAVGFGGMNIYDVTNAAHPVPLAEGVGDFTVNGQGKKAANEIHSVFAWDAGDRAYAVTVDNEEFPDVDIIDITNPKKAFLTAEYDLAKMFPQILQAAPANLVENFLHDMVVKEIGGRQVMLLSYWDSGYVKLDVTDVKNPIYLGDSDFANPDREALESNLNVPPEGNAHQAEFTRDNDYIVAADEDFDAYAVVTKNNTDNTSMFISQGSDTRKLADGESITGPGVFVGRACDADPAVPPGGAGTQIAVVERGVCPFTEKIANVIEAGGYEGALVFNRTAQDGCSTPLNMSVSGNIPTVGVATRADGFAIFNAAYDHAACLAGNGSQQAPIALGTVGDELSLSSYFDGWGYVHLYSNNNGKLVERDTYAIPEAHDPAFAVGFGDLSVHEVATSQQVNNRMYFSYYSGGFRVAEIENDQIVEKGHYIAADGSNFWGVEVFQRGNQEYVAASDRDHGLWIFKYNP